MRLLDLPTDLASTLNSENSSDIGAATDLPLDAALAIDTAPRTCGRELNSAGRSGSSEPPWPVPVGSPVCPMKPSITRWKTMPS